MNEKKKKEKYLVFRKDCELKIIKTDIFKSNLTALNYTDMLKGFTFLGAIEEDTL